MVLIEAGEVDEVTELFLDWMDDDAEANFAAVSLVVDFLSRHELRKLFQLRNSQSRLDISQSEIVTDLVVDVSQWVILGLGC